MRLRFQPLAELPDGVGDIADHFQLREVDRVDFGREEVDVDDGAFARAHEERRLFDHVVADVDDAVGAVDQPVHVVAVRQRRGAHPAVVGFADHALAHLGGEERDAGPVDEAFEHLRGALAVGPGAAHQQRTAGAADGLDRRGDRLVLSHRAARSGGRNRVQAVGAFAGDVFRKFQVHRPGPLLLGDPERLAHTGRNGGGRDDLVRIMGDRLHQVDQVENLESTLLGGLDRLLAGDHHHRHRPELGVGGGGDEVGRAGPQRRQAHARAPGQTAFGGGHEAGGLLVAGDDQLDGRGSERFEKIEVFLAGHAVDPTHALGFETFDQQFGGIAGHRGTPVETRRSR